MEKILNFKEKFIYFKDKIFDALFPDNFTCIFCEGEISSGHICDNCLKENIFNEGNRCQICDSPIKDGNIVCDHCKKYTRYYEKCISPFVYDGNVRKSILKFKSDGAKYLAKYFAKFIYERLIIENIDFDVIVPVPSHKKTIKERGYNPAKVLAEELSKLSGKPCTDALYKTFQTQKQKLLNFEQRQSNLENSITLFDKTAVNNKNVLIVDDIITTSATINTCAKLMTKAKTIYACSIARRKLG